MCAESVMKDNEECEKMLLKCQMSLAQQMQLRMKCINSTKQKKKAADYHHVQPRILINQAMKFLLQYVQQVNDMKPL